MDTYSTALKTWLGDGGQPALAAAIGKSQPAISRYAAGVRFPDAQTARDIDTATAGKVSFAVWQAEAMRRLGIEEAA